MTRHVTFSQIPAKQTQMSWVFYSYYLLVLGHVVKYFNTFLYAFRNEPT